MRIIDPAAPSPLVSLMADVEGAMALRARPEPATRRRWGSTRTAKSDRRPQPSSGRFRHGRASPTFSIVPPGIDDDPLARARARSWRAAATPSRATPGFDDPGREPALLGRRTADHGGRARPGTRRAKCHRGVRGRRGSTTAPRRLRCSWIAYDRSLGPDLREVPSLAVQYYGFDTTRPPFDDVRVRQAFGAAVDWRRSRRSARHRPRTSATSMVPPGIPAGPT